MISSMFREGRHMYARDSVNICRFLLQCSWGYNRGVLS